MLLRLARIAGCLVIAVVALEALVWIFIPCQRRAVTVNIWDPVLGVRQQPNAHGWATCPEYTIDLDINANGLRDRDFPYAKPAGTRRILCLGDSFTCGYGVHVGETYAKRLESSVAIYGWEVINAGVGSTGTAEQVAYFESDGRFYAPDIVVLCFFPGNDFWDNRRSELFTCEDGRLARHPVPRPAARALQGYLCRVPGSAWLLRHSHVLNHLKWRVAAHYYARLGAGKEELIDRRSLNAAEDTLTLRLLRRLHDDCTGHESRLVVMVVPPPADHDLPARTTAIFSRLAAEGVPVLDLGPTLNSCDRANDPLCYPRDRHWTKRGHAVVAEALNDHLRRIGYM